MNSYQTNHKKRNDKYLHLFPTIKIKTIMKMIIELQNKWHFVTDNEP